LSCPEKTDDSLPPRSGLVLHRLIATLPANKPFQLLAIIEDYWYKYVVR
jgi:hypothetical protein